MAKKQEKCLVEDCDEVAAYGRVGYCAACYTALYRMMGRTPAWIAERTTKVRRFVSRLTLYTPRGRK